MLLPFVREIFADAQKSAPFARLLARLKDQTVPFDHGAGRISVSGLTPTATLLHMALLHGALRKPLVVLVANNRAVVEMPGEYALRGGILDVFSPEAERPLRIEFFGDEVESIRSFDPHSQRSHQQREEALLLPLTETAVTPEVLAAIHARLSGKRLTGTAEMVEQAVAAGGVSVFPGWESYAAVAGAPQSIFGLQRDAVTLLHEPSAVASELESWWQKV